MNKVLVLLASYNGSKYINDQVISILNQNNVDTHILVSDDGSTDNTKSVVNKLSKKYKSRIRLIRNKFSTKASAVNFFNLILRANANNYDYIALSDQDDIFLLDKFFISISNIKKTNADLISSSVKCFGSSNKIIRQSVNQTKYDFLFEGAGQGCTFIMKKSFFLAFQKFIKNNFNLIQNFYYHDWLIYLFCRVGGYKWLYINQYLTLYRIHDNNVIGNKFSFKGIIVRLMKIFNGWYYEQVKLANKIAKIIEPKIIDIFEINLFNLFVLLLFFGRRKYSDRLMCLIGIIYSKVKFS